MNKTGFKYFVTINQKAVVDNDLDLDIRDVFVFMIIHSFVNSNKCVFEYEDETIWYWVSHSKIIKDCPILNVSEKTIYRIINKLISQGFLIRRKMETGQIKSFYAKGPNWDLLTYDDKNGGSDKSVPVGRTNLSGGSDKSVPVGRTNLSNNNSNYIKPTMYEGKSPAKKNSDQDSDWVTKAKNRSKQQHSNKQQKNNTDSIAQMPFECLKNDYPIIYEQMFLMRYGKLLKRLETDEQKRMIDGFNNKVIIEELKWEGRILAARLNNYVDNWINNNLKNKGKGKL